MAHRTLRDTDASSSPRRVVVCRPEHFSDISQVSSQLSDSDNVSLDVRVKLFPDTEPDNARRVGALLREHLSRFRSLDISVPTQDDAEMLVSSIGHSKPAPLLESLQVKVEQPLNDPVDCFAALADAFHPSPLLTHLTIPSIPLPEMTIPHYCTVTSLTIDSTQGLWDIELAKILDLIESMPHLQSFTFLCYDNFSYTDTSRFDHPRVVPGPNLLHVDVSAPGCGLDILRALSAPKLTNLRLDGYRPEDYQEDPTESLTEPIPVSLRRVSERSPSLKHLELHSTVTHNPLEDYAWLFSNGAFPHLEVLRLDAADISDESLLTGVGHKLQLKRLELLNCKEVSGSALVRFVTGRSKEFVLLLENCPSVAQEDIASLSKIVTVEHK
jgi:hypothetical protein